MNVFEISKMALRKYLIENKEKVVEDLIEMRKKSEGIDIYNYVDKLEDSFSFDKINKSDGNKSF